MGSYQARLTKLYGEPASENLVAQERRTRNVLVLACLGLFLAFGGAWWSLQSAPPAATLLVLERSDAAAARRQGLSQGADLVVWTSAVTDTAGPQRVALLLRSPGPLSELPIWLRGGTRLLTAVEQVPLPITRPPSGSRADVSLLALHHYASGDWPATTRALNAALAQQDLRPQEEAALLRWRALAALRGGDAVQAHADLDAALALAPADGASWAARGLLHAMAGEHGAARSDDTAAIDHGFATADVFMARGVSADLAGDAAQAVRDFDAAIRRNPAFAPAFTSRGITRSYQGLLPAAIADFTAALRLDPGDLDAYDYRADAYRDLGDYDRAIADYDQLIARRPTYAEPYGMRGSTLMRKGDVPRALADLDRMIALQTQAFFRQALSQLLSLQLPQAAASLERFRTWRDDPTVRADAERSWRAAVPTP